MRVIYISEIIGKPGIYCVKEKLEEIKSIYKPDFILANSNSATSGFGLGKNHCIYLKKMGVDLLINGDKAFFKKDMVEYFSAISYAIRPFNLDGNIGRGWAFVKKNKKIITIISLIGMSDFMNFYPKNPFTTIKNSIEYIKEKSASNVVIVNFFSLASAERQLMGHLCEELGISAMIGSGSFVQSADFKVLNGRTAYICESGKTASSSGVCGFDAKNEIEKIMYKIPKRSFESWDDLELNGLVLDFDQENGFAKSIDVFKMKVKNKE